jgi:hypothetical protein
VQTTDLRFFSSIIPSEIWCLAALLRSTGCLIVACHILYGIAMLLVCILLAIFPLILTLCSKHLIKDSLLESFSEFGVTPLAI